MRLYVYLSGGAFITGNINFRIFSGSAPGGDVYFSNVINGTNGPSTGRLNGDPGAEVTYSVTCNGSNSEN